MIKLNKYGYPTQKFIRELKKKLKSDNIQEAIEAFYSALQCNYYNACGIEEIEVRGQKKKVFAYHTLGWSGNEEIINVLKTSFLYDMLLERYDSGGHYYFTVLKEILSEEYDSYISQPKQDDNKVLRFTVYLDKNNVVVDQFLNESENNDTQEVTLYLSKKFIEFAYAWLQEIEFNEFIDKYFEKDI